jgi:hypothetical protein
MFSIYFKAHPELVSVARIDFNCALEAGAYWDKLSKANFYMVSTRP